MPTASLFSRAPVLAAVLLAAGLSAAQAQTANRSVQPAPSNPAPAAAPAGNVPAQPGGVAPAGLPTVQNSPGGLSLPNAGGLPSPNPVNLASPGTPPGTPVMPVPNTASPNPTVPNPDTAAVIQPGQTMGAPGAAAGGAPGPAQNVPSGPNPYSAQQLALAFRAADGNLNGELTRAEAQRLSIMPASFEEMDRNKDGILSRSEFEDGVR